MYTDEAAVRNKVFNILVLTFHWNFQARKLLITTEYYDMFLISSLLPSVAPFQQQNIKHFSKVTLNGTYT